MSTWLERFVLAVMVAILAGTVLTNPWGLDATVKVSLAGAIVAVSLVISFTIEKIRRRDRSRERDNSMPPLPLADGRGGRGGGGDALAKGAFVLGGRGGRGGAIGSGRGGDGGGGNAVGDGSMVIGGDGGDAGRIDGRGGVGAASSLKRLSPEVLRSFGLTGNAGYGQGGRGANSPEYDRCLRVLSTLSAEYASSDSVGQLTPVPGVLMPPVEWVHARLAEKAESFRVELIDNETDFLLRARTRD